MKSLLHTLLFGTLALSASWARESRALRVSSSSPWEFKPLENPVGRVVLVHGFFETGSSFLWMKKRLEAQGFECLVPRLRPSDARHGLEPLAVDLKRAVDSALGPEKPFSIIAFSMGGLISRHYLQELGGAPRCRALFTISSPHQGTLVARIYPGEGARQMRPGSDFLARLSESESKLGSIPVVSYRTPMDLVILPADSSKWDRADNLEFPVLLHPMMVTSRPVFDDILRRLPEP